MGGDGEIGWGCQEGHLGKLVSVKNPNVITRLFTYN